MAARNARGTGRPDGKMTRSVDDAKIKRFGAGSPAHKSVQGKANTKRRQRDRFDPDHESTEY